MILTLKGVETNQIARPPLISCSRAAKLRALSTILKSSITFLTKILAAMFLNAEGTNGIFFVKALVIAGGSVAGTSCSLDPTRIKIRGATSFDWIALA